MVQTGHQAYRQNVGNAIISKEQLLLKLYEGSLNFLRLARRGMEEKNPRIKGENISKIIAIMTELDCALDMDAGGEIAENLSMLYQHIIFRLVESNVKNDLKGLDEVEHILSEIKEGFMQAVKLTREIKETPVPVSLPLMNEHKEGLRIAI
ncbi:MAG: flagellar export chaperone FliS [Desulfobacteraceae bacterium]|jgi:flagellar protein FliS